jgi:hypothetical protein
MPHIGAQIRAASLWKQHIQWRVLLPVTAVLLTTLQPLLQGLLLLPSILPSFLPVPLL